MTKHYVNRDRNVIVFHMAKANLSRTDLCRALDITTNTLGQWIGDVSLIRLKDLITMSGLFGIPVEELVYLLIRAKPQINKQKASKKVHKKYLFDIRERSEDVF